MIPAENTWLVVWSWLLQITLEEPKTPLQRCVELSAEQQCPQRWGQERGKADTSPGQKY